MSDKQIEKLKERITELEATLESLKAWASAYPLAIFPELDLKLAAKVLNDAGLTLDALSASAMRYVLTQVVEKIDEAQPPPRAEDMGADMGAKGG